MKPEFFQAGDGTGTALNPPSGIPAHKTLGKTGMKTTPWEQEHGGFSFHGLDNLGPFPMDFFLLFATLERAGITEYR